jgi:hypothetical protein
MAEIKLHNGKPAKTASLKEINAAIKWFSERILDFEQKGINLTKQFQEWKSQLEAYRSDRIGKK